MNDKLNVLFLGGAKRVSLAEHLIDTARRKGLDVEVYSYELDEFVPIASVGTVLVYGGRMKTLFQIFYLSFEKRIFILFYHLSILPWKLRAD